MANSQKLNVLIRPCNSGMCPALYSDSSGKIFVQGAKLSPEGRGELAVAGHEEVVEITPDLIEYLKSH